ncbi:MAG: hypothetical protein WC570_00020 [Patescibacteria group bacterium]
MSAKTEKIFTSEHESKTEESKEMSESQTTRETGGGTSGEQAGGGSETTPGSEQNQPDINQPNEEQVPKTEPETAPETEEGKTEEGEEEKPESEEKEEQKPKKEPDKEEEKDDKEKNKKDQDKKPEEDQEKKPGEEDEKSKAEGEPKPQPAQKAGPEKPDVGKGAADAGKGAADAGKAAGDVASTAGKGAAAAGEGAVAAGEGAAVAGAEAGAAAGTGGTALIPIAIYEGGKKILANKTVRRILEYLAWILLAIFAIIVIIIVLLLLGVFTWFSSSGPSGSSNKQPTPIANQTTAVDTPTGTPPGVTLPNTGSTADLSTYDHIDNAPTNSLSDEFISWANELAALDRDLVGFFTDEIKKADTCEESLPLLEKSANILAKIDEYKNKINPNNDEALYYNYLKNFYQTQDGRLISMAEFNEIFEYLLIQTGQGGEIKGNMVDDATLRTSRAEYLKPMMDYLSERKITKLNAIPQADSEYIQNQISELEKHRDLIVASVDEETKPRDNKYPPALEFLDERELKILLPQTKDDYTQYGAKDITVDTRVYYLLSYIYHVQEMTGPDFEIYKNSQFIQDPSTPTDILSMCTVKLEDDPSYCGANNFCGVGQRLYAQKWLTGNVDNIGVPYKDRAHLKIWLGLDAPYYADEIPTSYTEAEKLLQVNNVHYDFKAVDISEIGLYNERIDCAACQGLSACSGTCLDNPLPCCPVELDSAQDKYVGVPVVWQHNQKTTDIINTARRGTLQRAPNSLPAEFGNLSIPEINDLFGININPNNFDYYQLSHGNTWQFFTMIGTQALNYFLYQIGLPDNSANNTNFNNPDATALSTNIGINYVNEVFELPNNYQTPIAAAVMGNNSTGTPLRAPTSINLINFTPNLHLSPTIHVNLVNALQNQNQTEAARQALANAGIQEINAQITGWPDSTIDPSELAGNGLTGVANRLGDLLFSQTLGLPTNYLFDQNNPKNTYLSKSASLIAAATQNQGVNYTVNNAILNSTGTLLRAPTATLHQSLLPLTNSNITQLFGTDEATSQKIVDYLANPDSYQSGHSAFISEISNNIDLATMAESQPYLSEYALQNILEQGTSPTLGNEFALTSLAAQITLEKIGANISKADADKIPYLLSYIALEQQSDLTPANTNQSLTNIASQFNQVSGGGESLDSFRERLINIIESATAQAETSNNYLYLTQPIKVTFNQAVDLNSDIYAFTDSTILPNYTTNPGQNTPETVNNILSSIGVDINSLNFVPVDEFDNQNSGTQQRAPTTVTAGQTYYAYPEIDLPEIIFPGIRPNYQYHNNVGQFAILASLTNVIQLSQNQPIVIDVYQGTQLRAPTDAPFLAAMNNKFVLAYSPLAGYTNRNDFLAHLGGTEYIFQTLNAIGNNNDTAINNLANIGSIALAYRYNGVDPTNFTSLDINEEQVANIINTAGIINSYQKPDLNFGMENMINFVRGQNVFANITSTHANINLDNIYQQFANGSYYNQLSDINQVKQYFNNYSSRLGNLTADQFLTNFVQTPRLDQMESYTQSIIAQNTSALSGQTYTTALNNVQSTINQNPANIFNLLSQNSANFHNYSPNYINDIANIGNNMISKGTQQRAPTTINSGLALIGSGQLIHNLGGTFGYNNFTNQFGSMTSFQNQPFSNLTNHLTNQFNQLTQYPDLFNDNIHQFINNLSLNYLTNNLLNNIDNDLGNNLYNQIAQLQIGNLSYNQLQNNLIHNLTTTLNNNSLPQLDNLTQILPDSTGTLLRAPTTTGDEIFTNCRQKIAQDNIVHLADIISSFYLNKRTQFYYGIESDDHGELLPADAGQEPILFPAFFEHQIFNHFIQDTIDIIVDKTTRVFRLIYPRDEEGLVDVNQRNDIWRNDCVDRDNQYLSSCKEYLHINF